MTTYNAGVCRFCFVQCYECSHDLLDDICASLKRDEVAPAPSFHDRTAAYTYDKFFKQALTQLANKNNRFLDHQQLAALQIPNTVQSLSCYSWMASYFDLVGDKIPNRENEIHLECITILEIFEEVMTLLHIVTSFY